MNTLSPSIPTGHINDAESMHGVIDALRELHGPEYDFALRSWHGMITFGSSPGQTRHFFVVEASQTCQDISLPASQPGLPGAPESTKPSFLGARSWTLNRG